MALGEVAIPGSVGTRERAERTLGRVVGAREQEALTTPGEQPEGQEKDWLCLPGTAQVPNSLGDRPWSLDPVKVCRAPLFAQGTLWSRAKAAAAAGTVCTNTGTGKSLPISTNPCAEWQGSSGTGGDSDSAGSCQGLQILRES